MNLQKHVDTHAASTQDAAVSLNTSLLVNGELPAQKGCAGISLKDKTVGMCVNEPLNEKLMSLTFNALEEIRQR